MRKALPILILFEFISLTLVGQTNIEKQNVLEEEVYVKIIDTLCAIHQFDFYIESLLHFDTTEYANNPADTFELIDPNTYETITKLGIDLKIEIDSLNFEEAKLYKQRLFYPNGVFIIGKIKNSSIHRNTKIEEHIHLQNYPDLRSLGELTNDILINNKIGIYEAFLISDKNNVIYKYVAKAYITFSGIQWDVENKYCIVECGYHFRYGKMGTSGSGFQAILKKNDNSVEIVKFIGLWEE